MPIIAGPGEEGSSLVLTRLWLNSVADPADVMSFRTASYTPTVTKPGEVRELAGGRLRLVTREGRSHGHEVVIRKPSDEQEAWLDRYLGEPVTVRDPDGKKYVATYLGLTVPKTLDGEDTVALSLSEITDTEAI